MSRSAYLDCVGGIAGDMLLGALLDAGGSRDLLEGLPRRLELEEVEIRIERTSRQGLGALHVDTLAGAGSPRHWPEIRELIEGALLPRPVAAKALQAFRRLVEAEARVHRVPVDEVHLHEVGAVDAIVEICGTAMLLEDLAVKRVSCSPLPVSGGLVAAAHGVLPLPAPASLELLRGAPLRGVAGDAELVTPTGAALASTLADSWGPLPPLVLEAVGYGAGTRDLASRPNVVRVLLGELQLDVETAEVRLLETNLDDLSPELVPDAVERCFAAGALDVWTVPAQMKKGRPGIVLSALVRPTEQARVAATILEETTALGVRSSRLERYELEREERLVELAGGSVRVKVGMLDGQTVNIAPEHDDCAALAARTGRPVKAVVADAMVAAATQ